MGECNSSAFAIAIGSRMLHFFLETILGNELLNLQVKDYRVVDDLQIFLVREHWNLLPAIDNCKSAFYPSRKNNSCTWL